MSIPKHHPPLDKRIALVAPSVLIEQIQELAYSEGRSMSSEIRIALVEHLARQGRSAGVTIVATPPAAEEQDR